jgi:hypothetical protein
MLTAAKQQIGAQTAACAAGRWKKGGQPALPVTLRDTDQQSEDAGTPGSNAGLLSWRAITACAAAGHRSTKRRRW